MKAELIDVMGDDIRVANAARVSFDKETDWDYVDQGGQLLPEGIYDKKLGASDQRIINFLAREGHWTPFSHVMITMREEVPIFVARQRFKHVVGFTYNEVSRRYVSDEPSFYVPDSWRRAAENKKQGSSDDITEVELILECDEVLNQVHDLAIRGYNHLLNVGVAPEQARMILPQSMMTSYYVTGSLAAWARAYKLRSDPHAQVEIQDLAAQWENIIGTIDALKYSWEALTSE